MIKGKKILIGVTGGIAAYKICELVSRLNKMEAGVKVVMTESAQKFVSPLTFQALSDNKVYTDMFAKIENWEVEHISLAREADIFLIAPCTANVIGKLASGIADDLLTTVAMAAKCSKIIAPAMNTDMYENTIVQDNIEKLIMHGYKIIEPDSGYLACGDSGKGRLPDTDMLVDYIEYYSSLKRDMEGRKILVTAGPTIEAIDPVRYITNHSSGKMGYAIAKAAAERGAEVTLVSGPVEIRKPSFMKKIISVESAGEMYNAVMDEYENNSVIIKAAAVGDYKPVEYEENKIKKSDDDLSIKLGRNKDILAELGKIKGDKILVGFAAETENIYENAKRKVEEKNLDMIVLNDLTDKDAGFKKDTNVITIINNKNEIYEYKKMTKIDVANIILDVIIKMSVS